VAALDTQEIYGSVGTEFGGGFGASVTAYYDIQRFDGLYMNGEVTYSLSFRTACPWTLLPAWPTLTVPACN
jgi:hypothetical protein